MPHPAQMCRGMYLQPTADTAKSQDAHLHLPQIIEVDSVVGRSKGQQVGGHRAELHAADVRLCINDRCRRLLPGYSRGELCSRRRPRQSAWDPSAQQQCLHSATLAWRLNHGVLCLYPQNSRSAQQLYSRQLYLEQQTVEVFIL